MRAAALLISMLALMLLPAVAPAQAAGNSLLTLKGTLIAYDEIAQADESEAFVEFRDAAASDATPPLAIQRIPLASHPMPVSFTLQVDRDRIEEGKQYQLRGGILTGPSPTWLSEPVTIDAQAPAHEPVTLKLAPFKAPPPEEVAETQSQLENIQGLDWVVEKIGDKTVESGNVTINFGVDGTLSGDGPCNGFKASYTVDGQTLAINNVAATKRACAPDLMEKERAFLDILAGAKHFRLGDSGALIIEDGKDQRIEARSE